VINTDDEIYVSGDNAGPEIKTLDKNDSHISNYNYSDGIYSYTWTSDDGSARDYTYRAADDGSGGKYYTGYYFAPSGTELTIKLQDKWNLRILNLPTGSTYSVSESQPEAATGFIFKNVKGECENAGNEETAEVGTVEETKINGVIEQTNSTYTVTYTNEYVMTDITIVKEWDDNDDQDGIRPESVQVQLMANGQNYGNPWVLSEEGAEEVVPAAKAGTGEPEENEDSEEIVPWSVTVTVPRFDDSGEAIEYTVEEVKTDVITGEDGPDTYGYEVTSEDNVFTITNTHTPGIIEEITVEKVWDDADDQDGIRPESVQIQLMADGKAVEGKTLELSEKTEWQGVFEDVPAYANGEKIEYTVEEVKTEVITGEDGPDTYGYEVSSEEEYAFTITNTHTPETFDIQVNKEWDFDENEDVELPESITINLLADGEVVDELELTEDSKWSGTFSGKQKYADSKEIVYTVTEEEVEGFGKPAITGDAEKGFTITNTYAMTALTVIKVWDDGEDPNRPDSIDVTLTNGDFSDKVKISKDDDWTHTWLVPKEEARVYKVTEDVDPNRYYYEDPAFDEETYTFTITNVLLGQGGPGTTTVIIEKVATGAKTPAATVFKVEGPDGYVKELKYSDFTDGKYELKDVTAGDYTVTEDENTAKVSGYTLKVSGDNGKKMEAEEGTEAVFKITNTYEKEPEPTPTPTPPSPPTPPTPPTPPELNKEDHFAYIIGNDEGLVLPAANITRAEVATIFFRMLTDESRDEYWSQTNGFSDVEPEEWFNNAISTMANAGILKGYEDGTFRPRASITRAEFATIAIRFFQDFTSTETYFSDVSGHWGEAYINMAAEKGLIKGYPDSTFHPDAAITRAEAMAIMNRLLERHPHKDHLLDGMITWPDNMDTDAWYYADVQEATNSHEYANGINGYEIWTKILPVRDWAAFEREWSTAHSASNPGDVVDKDFSLDLSDLEDVDEDS
jgi:hypothetical protein